MSSNPINIPGGPNLPNIGYYSKSKVDDNSDINSPNSYSYNTLKTNLTNTCTNTSNGKNINSVTGIYNDPKNDTIKKYLPEGIPSLDIPFYLAKSGVLMDQTNISTNLPNKVKEYCNSTTQNVQPIIDQIQYLTCQLEKERNREYDPSSFDMITSGQSIKDIFKKHSKLKPFLIVIFIITIYLLVSGFFASMDLTTNIFEIITNSSELNYQYWIGLLLGIIIPIIVLCVVYSKIVCKNLSDLEKFEITNNAYGIKNPIPSDLKKFDFMTLILFIFLIYAFIAVLFTIKKSFFGIYIYTALIGTILFIIALFLYVLYAFVPFFNTTDDKDMLNNQHQPLRLFIDQQTNESPITTNQYENAKIKYAFMITFVIILFLTILFFMLNTKNKFISGFLSSSAILSIPLLWVFNFVIGINYFYIYPIILVIMRFIRYIIMSLLYIVSEKSDSLKDKFSDDLIDQLNNFKNFSPTWGLIGVDELKLMLNVFGYENLFSKIIIPEDDEGKNISQNRFVSTGFLNYIINFIAKKETNMKGIIYSILLLFITILITFVTLYNVNKN
jgi:hypothetical protein